MRNSMHDARGFALHQLYADSPSLGYTLVSTYRRDYDFRSQNCNNNRNNLP